MSRDSITDNDVKVLDQQSVCFSCDWWRSCHPTAADFRLQEPTSNCSGPAIAPDSAQGARTVAAAVVFKQMLRQMAPMLLLPLLLLMLAAPVPAAAAAAPSVEIRMVFEGETLMLSSPTYASEIFTLCCI
jgi:hypothetical protein